MIPTPIIVGGGAIALLAWQQRTGLVTPPPPGKPTVAGANMSTPVGGKLNHPATTIGNKGALRQGYISALVASGGGQWTTNADVAVKQKIRELEQAAKDKYNELSGAAKQAAAKILNDKLHLNLTGKESWEEATRKVGAGIGSIVVGSACSAIPIPGVAAVAAATVCATLGAMVGAYLGEKLGAWGKKIYGDIKSWADKQWSRAKDLAASAYDHLKFW